MEPTLVPDKDCSGVIGGEAVADECGVCDGDGSTCCENACTGETPDCDGAGTCACDAGLDCLGVCGGQDFVCVDCNGEFFGYTETVPIEIIFSILLK